MLPVVINEKEVETSGPNTGNWKMYSRLIIPNVNRIAPETIILILLLKSEKAVPIPSPNSPVKKGKIMSSVGSMMNNSMIVRK